MKQTLAVSSADLWERLGFPYHIVHWLHTWPRRYGFAVLAVAAATLVRFGIGVVLRVFPPFILFFPAIILVALWAGFGPGVFATLLSAASGACFFGATLRAFESSPLRDIVGCAAFPGGWIGDLYPRRPVPSPRHETHGI